MKTNYLAFILLTALASVLSAPAVASEEGSAVQERGTAADRQSVIDTIDRWRAAIVSGDRDGLIEVYHPDLAYGHAYGAVLTRTQQIDTTLQPGRIFTSVDAENLAVRIYGDNAYVTGTWTFNLKRNDGSTAQSRLSGLDVWTRDGGKWRMIARQLTRPTAPPAP